MFHNSSRLPCGDPSHGVGCLFCRLHGLLWWQGQVLLVCWQARPGMCMSRAGASLLVGRVLMVARGGLQNGASQHQCPCGQISSPKWLPPASVSPLGVPVASCPSGSSPRLARKFDQAPFKSLPICRDSEHVRFCVHSKSGVSISHSPLALLKGRSEPDVLGACLPGEGSLDWGTCCGS